MGFKYFSFPAFCSLAALSLLNGCIAPGSLRPEQCANIDWYQQGIQYAQAGRTEEELINLGRECQRAGIAVNVQAYQQGFRAATIQDCHSTARAFQMGGRGERLPLNCSKELAPEFYAAWDSGLRTYCVPEFGFELGRSGGSYNNVCPAELQPSFKAAYDRGHAVFEQVQALRQQTKGLRARLESMEQALERNYMHTRALYQRDPNDPEVTRLKQERLMLENQKQMLESQLWDMQGQITRSEVEK